MQTGPGKADQQGKKKRLFYLIRPAAGGMRSHLQQLLNHFSRDYTVCLGGPPGNGLAGPAEGSSFGLPLGEGISLAGDLGTFRRLHGLLLTVRPALLHIHGFRAALPGLPAAYLARVPVLITAHNYPAHPILKKLSGAGSIPGAFRAHYIAVSNSLADELAARGIPRERISVIHNGIDPARYETKAAERFSGRGKADRILVATAARFAPQKGLRYFVEAAAVLASLFPQMRFLMIGDGPERPALKKLGRQLGLEGRLSFCGYCADLPRRFAEIDIFVLSSLTEGFSLVLLEASAAGCAVVASRVGGTPELIADGVHGLLVPPADVIALARAIASLARDPARAQRLARACRERVRTQFSLERMLSQTAALYERLTAESGRRVKRGTALMTAGKR